MSHWLTANNTRRETTARVAAQQDGGVDKKINLNLKIRSILHESRFICCFDNVLFANKNNMISFGNHSIHKCQRSCALNLCYNESEAMELRERERQRNRGTL